MAIATDCLLSYRAAIKMIGNVLSLEGGHRLNNKAETSHQPFRRGEGTINLTVPSDTFGTETACLR